MSWNLFQKIANYIIFYGSDIIGVYTNLLKIAQKQLDIKSEIVWLPIILLLIVYALFGMLAAIIGIITGKKLLKQPAESDTGELPGQVLKTDRKLEQNFNYSIWWLSINIILLILSLVLLNTTKWPVWSSAILVFVVIWSIRYRRALRQLAKPKFWLFFVFITLVTAIVFAKVSPGESMFMAGLMTGIQMNFRAVIILAGFSALGTELYNPVIRNFFLKTSFKNLPLALELSAESLPLFIASVPDFKSLIRNPVSAFYRVISQADRRLAEITGNFNRAKKVIILTGSASQGKTTCARSLVVKLIENGIAVTGFFSDKIRNGSRVTGYNLVNIETGESKVFLSEDREYGIERIGRFTICRDGLAMGIDILNSCESGEGRFVVIDEVGRLELHNRGWSDSIGRLLQNPQNIILMTVRDIFVSDIIKK
jgi:nucleoside-triphosphatase THEP1